MGGFEQLLSDDVVEADERPEAAVEYEAPLSLLLDET